MSAGLVLVDRLVGGKLEAQARAAGVKILPVESYPDKPPFARSMIVLPGIQTPWDMVPVGMNLLTRWDVAAPFARDGKLAYDLGTPEDRDRTVRVLHDLRVPTYAHELLLVRAAGAGPAFLSAWRAECDGGDERLAFLRALATVKPLFLALPRSWLSTIDERAQRDRAAGRAR